MLLRMRACECACVRVCVRACARSCVCAFMCACVRACVRACVVSFILSLVYPLPGCVRMIESLWKYLQVAGMIVCSFYRCIVLVQSRVSLTITLLTCALTAFWWAMIGSQMLQGVLMMCLIARLDWSQEIEKVCCSPARIP